MSIFIDKKTGHRKGKELLKDHSATTHNLNICNSEIHIHIFNEKLLSSM
jgi:hypothetical protein